MPGRVIFPLSSMVLGTRTQTSLKLIWEVKKKKRKQETETGTQTLLELKAQSIWRQPWDGMGIPGRLACRSGPPGSERRWPVPRLREGHRVPERLDATPAVTQRRVPPHGTVPSGRPRLPAPSDVPRPRHPARLARHPETHSESRRPRGRTPSPATECPRPSPRRRLPQTEHRAAAAATRASPQLLSRHVTSGTWPRPLAPQPVDARPCGPRGPLGKRVRPPAPGRAAIVTMAVGILHVFPGLAAVCVCSLAAFSFSYAASRLFKHLRELLYQSNGERAEITGWGPTQRQGPKPGHCPGHRTKMFASPALFWLYPRSSHPVHVLPHLSLFCFLTKGLCV